MENVKKTSQLVFDPRVARQLCKKNFYIIDDIYATGNTMKAIKHAIEDAGGIIKGEGVIMNIKELNNKLNKWFI